MQFYRPLLTEVCDHDQKSSNIGDVARPHSQVCHQAIWPAKLALVRCSISNDTFPRAAHIIDNSQKGSEEENNDYSMFLLTLPAPIERDHANPHIQSHPGDHSQF
jgi:hypothetical protein